MDWNMIGAVGEILGAAGVIVTLAYLAKQIRHSNTAARHQAQRETLDLTYRFLEELAGSPQVASLFRRGVRDDPDLTDDEIMQLRALFLQLTTVWQRAFEYETELAFHVQIESRRELVGTPGYRKWFAQRKHWLNPDFRAELEKEIAESPGLTLEWGDGG